MISRWPSRRAAITPYAYIEKAGRPGRGESVERSISELMEAAERGDRSVTGALFTALYAELHRLAKARLRSERTGHTLQPTALVHEVYLRMLRIPNIESIRSPEAYLFTVAQHVAQQHTLRQIATPPSVELTQMLDIPSASGEVDPVLAADTS